MGTKLFVGNLSFDTTSPDLEAHFKNIGEVVSAQVITDRATGRSRGFGFVEMASGKDAQRAIQELNGTDLGGRTLNVSEARERADRDSRPRGGGFGGGGGGGGGGG